MRPAEEVSGMRDGRGRILIFVIFEHFVQTDRGALSLDDRQRHGLMVYMQDPVSLLIVG